MADFPLSGNILAAFNVLYEDFEGESVLLNLQTEEYFGLDDIGTRIWQTLIEQDSIQAAMDALLVEYKVEPGRL